MRGLFVRLEGEGAGPHRESLGRGGFSGQPASVWRTGRDAALRAARPAPAREPNLVVQSRDAWCPVAGAVAGGYRTLGFHLEAEVAARPDTSPGYRSRSEPSGTVACNSANTL